MKFDKETIILFVVCGLLIVLWEPLCIKMGWVNVPAAQTVRATVPPDAGRDSAAAKTAERKALPSARAGKDVAVAAAAKKEVRNEALPVIRNLPCKILENDEVSVKIDPNLGVIEAVTMKKFMNADKTANVVLAKNVYPGTLAVYADDEWRLMEVVGSENDPDSYTLYRRMANSKGQNFLLKQSWKLRHGYTLAYEVAITNESVKPLLFETLIISGGSIEPLRYLSGDQLSSDPHSVDYLTMAGKFVVINATESEKNFNEDPVDLLKWIGVGNKYFVCLLVPQQPFCPDLRQLREALPPEARHVADKDANNLYTIGVGGVYSKVEVPAGNNKSLVFKYYCGPKEISWLKQFDDSTSRIMNLAWGPMNWIAILLLKVLVWLNGLCYSYGWSIIILTIIVRLAFWPITQKANASMKKMQRVQPMIQEIRTKYKDDAQQMNTKIMELYKKEKINPLGGCLPILLQIPVFIALYSALDGAIELRQVSFLWAHDLVRPDTVAVVWGLPINPLVLIMTALMVLQQKMTPAAADPMQQKMLLLMPVVMLFILYSLPSGLTLYWTVSQIISIIQLLISRYGTEKDAKKNGASA